MADTDMNGITRRLCSETSLLNRPLHITVILIPHVLMFSITYFLQKKEKTKKACVNHQGIGLIKNSNKTLGDLPNDVLVNILVRLTVKSLCRVQCVSKSFFKLVNCPYFATLVEARRLLDSSTCSINININRGGVLRGEVPQLVFLSSQHDSNHRRGAKHNCSRLPYTFQALEYNGEHTLRETKHCLLVPEVFNPCAYAAKLEFVFCNLFCFSFGGFRGFLVNPFRGEVLKLPEEPMILTVMEWSYSIWYGMGLDDITHTLKIVRVAIRRLEGNNGVEAVGQVCELGRAISSWRKIESVPECELSYKNASAYGDMHWLVRGGVRNYSNIHIISFDFKKDKFDRTPRPKSLGQSYDDLHLINIKGFLAIVDLCGPWYFNIFVLRDYHNIKFWTLYYTVGTTELTELPRNYAGTGSAILCCGEWEHGIFFREKDDPNVYYYLDTRCDSVTQVKLESLSRIPKMMRGIFYKAESNVDSMIYSYTRSLISLKNYGSVGAQVK